MELWEADRPKIDQITGTFLEILHASATDPDAELEALVPDVIGEVQQLLQVYHSNGSFRVYATRFLDVQTTLVAIGQLN